MIGVDCLVVQTVTLCCKYMISIHYYYMAVERAIYSTAVVD